MAVETEFQAAGPETARLRDPYRDSRQRVPAWLARIMVRRIHLYRVAGNTCDPIWQVAPPVMVPTKSYMHL